jgi:CSLREA domain-containing protein
MKHKKLSIAVLVLALVLALMPSGHTAQAAPYTTVNSTNDLNDGTCDGTHCSLREAIHVANSNSGYADTIRFNITSGCSAGGVCKIQPTSALPALTDDGTTIDGYSQPGADEATDITPAELLIEIVGISVDSGSGLTINSAGNVIKGLVINGFMSQNGVEIYGSGAMSNTVSGNYIGVNATGTAVTWGNGDGVSISGGAQNNTIGGDTAAERNVISGNIGDGVHIEGSGTTGNTVSGNYIGTNATGTAGLDNGFRGVYISGGAQNNTIGGHWTWGERNVISGNVQHGVLIYGSGTTGNIVSGNYIGTDEGGTAYLRNRWHGVCIGGGAQNNTVGGDTAGERNVISDNGWGGVCIEGSGTVSNTVSGNYIGTKATGTADLGNTESGVHIWDDAQNNTVGPGNVIAYNGWDGVDVYGSSTTGNTVTQNSIFSNTVGINLLSGANGGIAAPVIVTTTVGSVKVIGTACGGCTVEVFENGDTDGEGETYVGDTTATSSGAFTVTVSYITKPFLTATATDEMDGTSEFSEVFSATVPLAPPVGPVYLPIVVKNY